MRINEAREKAIAYAKTRRLGMNAFLAERKAKKAPPPAIAKTGAELDDLLAIPGNLRHAAARLDAILSDCEKARAAGDMAHYSIAKQEAERVLSGLRSILAEKEKTCP